MENFFIQIDKPFYFAGDVVNGNILVNVMQPIAATGISLKFTGYECVKWNTSREIVRPPHVQGQPPPPDPIAAIPPHLIYNSDVIQSLRRTSMCLMLRRPITLNTTIAQNTFVHPKGGSSKCTTLRHAMFSRQSRLWFTPVMALLPGNIASQSLSRLSRDGLPVLR